MKYIEDKPKWKPLHERLLEEAYFGTLTSLNNSTCI
jgi:hypothetical protein